MTEPTYTIPPLSQSYEREKALKLRALLPQMIKENTDPATVSKAREYVRGYFALHPEDQQQTGVESNVGILGGEAPASREIGLPALEANDARMAERMDVPSQSVRYADQLPRRKLTPPPEYPPDPKASELIALANTDPDMVAWRQATGVAQKFEEQAALASLTQDDDSSLPSASKVKSVYRRPEYAADPKQIALGGGQTASFRSASSKPVYYSEPSFSDFKAEMTPILGERAANQLKDDSFAFKAWQDAKYAHAYDTAKANGFGIVRLAYARDKNWTHHVQGALDAAVPSALRSYTLGGSDVIDATLGGKPAQARTQLAEESFPRTAGAAGVVGMLAPHNLGVGVFEGIGRGLSKVPAMRRLEATTGGRILGGGLRGGAGAMGMGGIEDANRALASAISTGNTSELVPDEETLKRTLLRGAIGAPLGAGAETLAAGAGGLRRLARDESAVGADTARAMTDLDTAGARSTLFGIKGSPEMRAIEERARLAPEKPSFVEQAGKEIEEPLLRSVGAQQVNVNKAMSQGMKTAMAAENKAGAKAVPWNAIDAAIAQEGKLRFSASGEGLPVPSGAGMSKELGKMLEGRPFVTDWMEAERLAAEFPDTVRVYSPAELQRSGLRLEQAGQKIGPDDRVVIRAREMTAEDAVNTWNAWKTVVGAKDESAGAHLKKPTAKSIHQEMRDFIAQNFKRVDSAIEGNERSIAARRVEREEIGLPDDLTVSRPREREPFHATADETTVHLEGPSRTKFQQAVRAPRQTYEQRRGFSTAAREAGLTDALNALRGEMARQVFGKQGEHGGLSVSGGGIRAYGVGKAGGALRRSDNILRAIARLPEEHAQELVSAVKKTAEGLPKELGDAIGTATRAIDEFKIVSERAGGIKRSLLRMTEADFQNMLESGISAETVSELRYAAEMARVVNERLGKAAAATRAEIQARKTPPEKSTKDPVVYGSARDVRSIRRGRPGRLGGVFGQTRESELSPSELTLLELILQANPEEEKKPKVVAAK